MVRISVTSSGMIARGHLHPNLMFQRHDGSPLSRFFTRYRGRTVIIHRGFPRNWLTELLKQPGGGGHFRIDITNIHKAGQSAIEWIICRHILPFELPLPLLMQVTADDTIYLRHLLRDGQHPVNPGEVFWFLQEITNRHHACLYRDGISLRAESGMPLVDNVARAMFESF